MPYRDKKYLEWITKQPSIVTGQRPSVYHHEGPRGIGQKTDDYRTLPLSDRQHQLIHNKGKEWFAHTMNIDFKNTQIRLMMQYLEETYNIDAQEDIIHHLMLRIRELGGLER